MGQNSASAAPISTKHTNVENLRKSVTFHPSVWRDHFRSYTSDVTKISGDEKIELERLKEKVKKLVAETPDNSNLKLKLIDAIQRLGVGYHFAREIDESLRQIHQTKSCNDEDDVHIVALRFRLLRQQGYRAPHDMFKKFMNNEGDFKESLAKDIEGMLSLYEASYYGVNGEEILDKAFEFSSSHLESLSTTHTSNFLLKEALETPINKTLIKLGAKKFISAYQEDKSHNQDLLHFAKLDFNITQKMHQNELNYISRWWEDLDFVNRLPFARDRLVECYFWILGVYFEPHYSTSRVFLTKIITMTSIIDDIYDVHGTFDELRHFTQVFRSWDINATDELPAYMRICFEALLGVYADMGDEIGLQYSIQTEAEWCYKKIIPTVEEYMKVALPSAAYAMLSTSSLVGMGDNVTKQDYDWIINHPRIVHISELIGRLMDDLAGYGKETKITVVDCYMNEHEWSEMEAREELSKLVKKAWKDLNDEWIEPRATSVEILERIVNLCRVLHIMYFTGEDEYTDSSGRTKQAIIDMLIDPIN